MDHLKMHSEVLFLSIVCILIIWIVVALFNYLTTVDKFISKRDMRKNLYGEYGDGDPDVDMNNDNTLLHYLDK